MRNARGPENTINMAQDEAYLATVSRTLGNCGANKLNNETDYYRGR